MGNYLEYLRKIPIFSELNEFQLSALSELVIVRKYKKKQIIFVEDEPGEAIHIVMDGKVKLTKSSPDGREIILSIRQSGEIFAEVVLFDGGSYPATAEAIEDAKIGLLRNNDVEQLITNNSTISISIIKTLSKRLRISQQKVHDLALKDTQGSMVSTLKRLAKEHGVPSENGIMIDLNLTHQELANFIGTSRESANRLISDLKKDNIVSVDKGKITIIDIKRLEQWE
jgi:CRP/FNR family transcriptional regulator